MDPQAHAAVEGHTFGSTSRFPIGPPRRHLRGSLELKPFSSRVQCFPHYGVILSAAQDPRILLAVAPHLEENSYKESLNKSPFRQGGASAPPYAPQN